MIGGKNADLGEMCRKLSVARWTCRAAIVTRELGIRAVVRAEDTNLKLPPAALATFSCAGGSCAEGETGRVYRGAVPHSVERTVATDGDRPATEIMINLGNPDFAFKTSSLSDDGVGLAGTECIISEHLEAHPHGHLHPDRFIALQKVGTIAPTFWPQPVVVRMSDR